MYVSITSAQIKLGQIDNYINAWDSLIKPEASKLPGIIDVYTLVNRDTNKGMTIALYDTEVNAIATQKNGTYQALVAKLAEFLLLDTLVREGYEVGSRI